MRYRLVLFDFDGTLADSLTVFLEVYKQIAPSLGLKPIEDIEAARSTPTRKLFKKLGIRFWRLPRVVRAFQTAAAAHAGELRLHPGVAAAINDLHERGFRLGILSSNREDVIRACLRAHQIEDRFAFVVGYPKIFGKAKALRRIIRQEQLDRTDVLYIGDELRDVEAGRKARVPIAAVTWGFHHENLLVDGSPTFIVRSPAELLTLAEHPTIPRSDELIIRRYRKSDEASVVALWETCGLVEPGHDARKDIRRTRSVRPDLLLVALQGGRIVGSAMAGYDGHRGWIDYLAVDPDVRRRGIGRALVAEAERRLRAIGCPMVHLQVLPHRPEALEFAKHLGFAVTEVITLGRRLDPPAPVRRPA